MGNRKYATNVMNFMKKEIPSFEMSETKVISRDDGHDHTEGKLVKTLRQLSPSDQSFYMILDDRADVWPESGRNLLKVYPYVYFNNPREEMMLHGYPDYFRYFTKEDLDPFLLYYGVYLKTLHDEYYAKLARLEDTSIGVDLRDIYSENFTNLFRGIHCVYTNIFPSSVTDPKETYEWYHTQNRGMNNMYEYVKGETNLVITSTRLKPSEIITQAKEDECPVVSVLWLHMCLHLNTLLPYHIFKPREENEHTVPKPAEGSENPEVKEENKDSEEPKTDSKADQKPESNPEIKQDAKAESKPKRNENYIRIVKHLVSPYKFFSPSDPCIDQRYLQEGVQ